MKFEVKPLTTTHGPPRGKINVQRIVTSFPVLILNFRTQNFFFIILVASDDLYCYLLHVYWSVCFTTYSRQAWLIENIQCTSIFALRSFDGPPWRCERRKSVRGEYCLRRLRREVSTIASLHRSDIASILVRPGLSIKLQILDLSLNNQLWSLITSIH